MRSARLKKNNMRYDLRENWRKNSSLQEEFWQLESITIRKQNNIDVKWKK